MKYFTYYQNNDKTYSIYFTEDFYKLVEPHYTKNNSYFNIFYRLYGLLPKDFYHYVGATYNASFKASTSLRHVSMRFKELADLNNFLADAEKRFIYCVERGDFN